MPSALRPARPPASTDSSLVKRTARFGWSLKVMTEARSLGVITFWKKRRAPFTASSSFEASLIEAEVSRRMPA